jgi:hypothetical protein
MAEGQPLYSLGMKVGAASPAPEPERIDLKPQAFRARDYVAAVVSPFATAAAILLFILAALEFLRPRFVSLFIDLRLVTLAAALLWLAAVLADRAPGLRRASLAPVILIFAAVLAMAYRMVLPFGRLGLVTLAAAAATLVFVGAACFVKPKH